jgi:iduronate 2-sulfatase
VPSIALHDGREIRRAFRDRPQGEPTPKETITLRHGYYAATSFVDAQVGKVLGELDRLGLAQNTIIVFWSDHGFHLGEHGLWAKTSNFELDARVPLIIATPDGRPGQTSDAIVELLDLYPTLAELCGLPAPTALEGTSLRPVLEDPRNTVKPAAFTWHPRPAYPADGEDPNAMGYSMRTPRFRYTEWRDFQSGSIMARELYDHANDPDETENVVHAVEHEERVAQLAALLQDHIARRKTTAATH